MKKWILPLLLLLVSVALATEPTLETSQNRNGFTIWAKRKGFTGIAGLGDTLYCGASTADSSFIFSLWPSTTLQVQGIAAGNDSCRFMLNILIGHADASTYGSLVKAYSFTFNAAGFSMPFTIPFTANSCMLEVVPLKGNGADTKARILISRSRDAGPVGPREAYSDTSTLNAPGSFPGISPRNFSVATFAATVTKLATSVTFRPEGYLRLLGKWAPLDAENDTLQFADSTSAFLRTYNIPSSVDSLRLRWTSEAGGTTAAVTSILKLSAQE